MVQREVKKKTSVYAAVAIVSAMLLVSTIYVFAVAPIVFPPSQAPSANGMHSFASLGDLKTYLGNTSSGYRSFSGGPLDSKFLVPAPMPATPSQTGSFTSGDTYGPKGNSESPESYSTTNIQVAGVDETDTVKTDGQYIYTVTNLQPTYYSSYGTTNSSNAIYVIKASSQVSQITAKIDLGNDTAPAGLFLSSDGNKLTVIASKYQAYNYLTSPAPVPMLYGYQADVYTYINVYDVSNHASPTLARNLTVSGSYFNSRMIDNYVYAIVSQPAVVYNNDVTLPQVYSDSSGSEISPSSVYYADMVQPSYYEFTSFFGVNIQDDNAQPTNMTVMMGGASTMYVSQDNIYMTYPTWDDGQYTSIYRVSINGADLTLQAQGSVPGHVINQYAMDENTGYFRVATNWYGNSKSNQQINNVYVLDQNLTVVGKLEGLAPDENLHSVRFMGDKVYLVTFKQTDPLFVIDLSQPTNPMVLGKLEIPGYSDYLHPYDSTHLIGLGKEAVDSEETDFAWYQGLKLALFDVGDVNRPTQLSHYVIGDRGTDSLALTEPKAFLFDKAKSLLVIPVSLALVDNSSGQARDSSYGQMVWQGAYVFSVSLDGGFTLKGTVTHIDSAQLNSQGHLKTSSSYYSTQDTQITRALYIGNTLYTFSNSMVKLNSLTDMSQTGQITLN